MPSSPIRTVVSFTSTAFNKTEHRSYFINKGCFGDDVAKWLIGELRENGVNADREPGQEDFGWYFNFVVGEKAHTFVIGYRPGDEKDEEGTWIGWIERDRGLFGSIFRARKRGIDPLAIWAIHSILSVSPKVQDVRWHCQQDFDKGREELGTPAP